RVWVTRTRPEADATAARVRARGFEAVVAPVLEARALAGAAIDLADVDALAFTSAHAVRAFAGLCDVRDLAVFAVGDRTADVAREAGFSEVRSAAGDAGALADAIASAGVRRVLHPRGARTAADLAALLAPRGVHGRPVIVYATAPTPNAAIPERVAVVLIHSPRAAACVAERIDSASAGGMSALCISCAAAEPLAGLGFARLEAAPFPNEAALLDLLGAP
ncbi:MAG TPA: uroporphyrinogen-III synthase, partial [Caulobacteraceae bacterium]|nr:uroporphyrinogen-III synthase [Caulobacteraceae bacterium]